MTIDDRDGAHRGVADDCTLADELDRPRVGQRRDRPHRAVGAEIDDREPLLGVAGDERRRWGQREPHAGRTAPRLRGGRTHGGSLTPTAREDRRSPAVACSREPSGADSRAGLRRPGLRAPRADARRARLGRRQGRRRGRPGRDGRMGGEAAADVRGRRARALLRPARLRDDGAAALHRPALGARRGAAAARHQLAGAGRAAVLHGDAAGPARRDAAPALPCRRAPAARHRRRGARRLDRRRRRGR